MRSLPIMLCSVSLLWLAAGCSTEGKRVDVEVEAVATQDFNPKDLQILARKGAEKLVAKVRETLGKDALKAGMTIFVAEVQNRTDEHIDTKIIQSYLEAELTDHASVRLVDRNKALEIAKQELAFQQGNLVDPKTAQEIGKHIGADHFVFAELSNIRTFQRSKAKEGQYFYFNLALVKVETLEKVPTYVEIQKLAKKGLFGW